MGSLATAEIEAFLAQLAGRFSKPATLYLLGGSALCFLGNPRRTVDIDYTVGQPGPKEELAQAITALADELRLELESVPIDEFVPLPNNSAQRHRPVGQFGSLMVYVYDPYTIALSKLARGFETDLQDVLFLLRREIIDMDTLGGYVEAALPQAWEYDIDPADLRLYWAEVRRQFIDQ